MSKKETYTDEELAVYLDEEINRSVEQSFNKLTTERAEVLDYYSGKRPEPFNERNSRYVSQDVFDAVNGAAAVIAEAFTQARCPVRFLPDTAQDALACDIATKYTNFVLYQQNDGHRIIKDTIFDGLTNRNAIIKAWWEPGQEETDYTFQGTMPELMNLLQTRDDLHEKASADLEMDDETGIVSGDLRQIRDTSQVRVAVVPPEEFLINPQARCIREADFICHRSMRLISDLVAEGYDEDQLREAGDMDSRELDYSPENVARTRMTQGVVFTRSDESEEFGREYVEVQECYVRLNLDDTRARRWKITKAGRYIMDRALADTVLFIAFCPMPIPHSFWGDNFAQRLFPTQNAKSVINRAILDNLVHGTFPRYLVQNGTLAHPEELMNTQIGGIVNVTDIEGIQAMEGPQLNPQAMAMLEQMDQNKESISGVSRLSQGLDKNAIGKQNSGELVSQLTSLSQTKLLDMARQLGDTLCEVFLAIYQLVLENDSQQHIIQVAGQDVQVDPTNWIDRRHAKAEVTLDPDQDDYDARQLAQTYAQFRQDPVIGSLIGPQQAHNFATRYLNLIGIQDTANYLLSQPPPPQPPQPSPLEIAQAQLFAAQAAEAKAAPSLEQIKLQIEQQKLELEARKAELDHQARMQEIANQHEIAIAKTRLAITKQEHEQDMDNEELHMAQDDKALQTIVSLKGN